MRRQWRFPLMCPPLMQLLPASARGALLRLVTPLVLVGCADRLPTTPAATSLAREASQTGGASTAEPVDTLLIGDSLSLVLDSATATGARARIDAVLWTTSDDYVATVDSVGLVRARAVGTATVVARGGGRYRETRLQVLAPAPAGASGDSVALMAPAPAPVAAPVAETPPAAGSATIALQVVRFADGQGPVLVSSSVPLAPGLVPAGDPAALRELRLLVAGVEQPTYVEPLNGRHADGSLRAVLLQFPYAVERGAPVTAELRVGAGARAAASDLPRPDDDRALPAAAVLPTDPRYLVSTDIVGATVTAADADEHTQLAARYDADFASYGDRHWSQEADTWGVNYYDRAAIYYAMWARTGKAEYWWRGTRIAVNYRRGYLEANAYGASPHWAQPDGMERHYLLTGDTMSLKALNGLANTLWVFAEHAPFGSGWGEGRILARTLTSYVLAWRLEPDLAARAGRARMIDRMLDVVARDQSPDGGFRFPGILGCDGTLNYMDGMLDDALIQTHTYYRADPRIVTVVKKSADYLWTQWVGAEKGFKYMSKACPTGDEAPTADLNNLMINAFAWTYAQSHDATYKARADEIFAGGIQGAFLYGSKQFNQHYTTSHHYLAYRAR